MVFSLITFIACSKSSSSDATNTDPNNIPAEQTVTANLQGRVLDQNGLPVQGAAVSSGTATTTTDVNGVFNFLKISMSSRFGYVKVAKTGYYTGSKSIITNGGASNYVSIELMPLSVPRSFAAASGGAVVIQTGDTAIFPSNAVVNASTNAAYTGNVNVYGNYLDPTASDLYSYMPGDLRGIGADGRETALASYGIINVDMEGDASEKLQLAAGKKAVLIWAIPDTLQKGAPASIAMWYFNDSTGRWIEEGKATRIGNSYVGQVGHFTYWMCAVPSATVNFKVHIKDQYGNPLPYTHIQLQTPEWGTRGSYTDADGFAQGLIPKGQTLVMLVETECGTVLGGMNVGPAVGDQDLGSVKVTISEIALRLSGTVVNCSNAPVDSGYVSIRVDGLNYRATVTKGAFTMPVSRCFTTTIPVQMQAFDFQTQQGGVSGTITASNGKVDAGQLSACPTP